MTNLKIISLNIERDKHLGRVVPFFKKEQADVLLLQEVLEKNLLVFRRELGMDYVFAPLGLGNWLSKTSDISKAFGIATFSKLKILENNFICYRGSANVIPVIEKTEPDKVNRGILKTSVRKNSKTFYLINNYFTWSDEGNPTLTQRVDLKKLLKLLSEVPEFVMCGDFNTPRGREIFDTLARHYHDNIPQNVTTTLDKNLHYAGDLQLVVDGLFTTPGYQIEDVRLVDGVSDHLAIVADVSLDIDNS